MGRAGYFGCLVMLGVTMLMVSCLAVFGASGAITAERGARAAAEPAIRPPPTHTSVPTRAATDAPAGAPAGAPVATRSGAPPPVAGPSTPAAKPSTTAAKPSAATPLPVGTLVPRPTPAGAPASVAKRLDLEAIGGGLKITVVSAAKETTGDRAVLAVVVRVENDSNAPIRVDPDHFHVLDRASVRHRNSTTVAASLPVIVLDPRSAPGEPGKNTSGVLAFELENDAGGLILVYEAPNGAAIRVPLPPEFG